jgi:hypothetical protein
VVTIMPSAAGVVQEAGVPARPSISTRHMRQEPNAFTLSVAQSFGTLMSAIIAARMIEVPAGTVTGLPSMVRVTAASFAIFGVPKSGSLISGMGRPRSTSRADLGAK